jgi:hypothetical protein
VEFRLGAEVSNLAVRSDTAGLTFDLHQPVRIRSRHRTLFGLKDAITGGNISLIEASI